MIFFRIIKGICLILYMTLTFVNFIGDDIKAMCFFGIVSIWFFIDLVHDRIMDKLK